MGTLRDQVGQKEKISLYTHVPFLFPMYLDSFYDDTDVSCSALSSNRQKARQKFQAEIAARSLQNCFEMI